MATAGRSSRSLTAADPPGLRAPRPLAFPRAGSRSRPAPPGTYRLRLRATGNRTNTDTAKLTITNTR
jgi:hypothetical protein